MLVKNRAFFMLVDIAIIMFSFLLALLAKFASFNSGGFILGQWYGCVLLIFIYLLVKLFYQPKKSLMERDYGDEFLVILTINVAMVFILSFILFTVKLGENSSREFYALFFIFNTICMYMGRLYTKSLLISYYDKKENKKRLLVCASDVNVLKVMNKLVRSKMYAYDVAAIAILNAGDKVELYEVGRNQNGTFLKTSVEGFSEYLKKQVVDSAILTVPTLPKEELNEWIKRLETLGIVVHVTVETFGLPEEEKAIEKLGAYRVLTYCPRIFNPMELFLKRCMDIVGGTVGALITLILGLFVAPLIYLESPGPVIFKQVRIGRNGRRFQIYKFRSMYMDAEERKKELMAQNEMDGLMFKMKDDPRITKVGKFIRKTSIDEFPQFFNVLKGDMSLVGTRPPTLDEFMKYEEHHKRRLSLKPGITGMWQVSGRSDIQDFDEVVRLDLQYIDNWSVWLDIKILVQTVLVVLLHRGAE